MLVANGGYLPYYSFQTWIWIPRLTVSIESPLAATFFPLALTFAVVDRIVVATLVTASFLEGFVMEGYVNKLGFTFNTKLNLGA